MQFNWFCHIRLNLVHAVKSEGIADSEITNEHWFLEPVQMRLVGIISPRFFQFLNGPYGCETGSTNKKKLEIQESCMKRALKRVESHSLYFFSEPFPSGMYEKAKREIFFIDCQKPMEEFPIVELRTLPLGEIYFPAPLEKLGVGAIL